MDFTLLFGAGLQLIEAILNKLKQTRASEEVNNAIAALEVLKRFHGTPVTKAQLESLRG